MSSPLDTPHGSSAPDPSGATSGEGSAAADEVKRLRAEVARLQAELDSTRRAEQSRTRRILESITDAFFALDEAWRFTYVNPQAGPLLDRAPVELIGKQIWEEFPEAVGSEFYEAYHRVRDEGRAVNFVAHYPPLGRWFDVTAYPVEGGGLSVFFEDVTERITVQNELRQSEARFRFLADTVPQIISTTTPDGTHVYFNQRWYEYTGISKNADEAWHWIDLVHPDDRDETLRRWTHALETGEPYENEYRFRRHDGVYRWHLGRALPRRDDDGSIVQWVSTYTDIHDQKLAHAALRASQERFARVVESGMMGVFFFDRTGHIHEANDAFLSMIGYSRDDLEAGAITSREITPGDYAALDAEKEAAVLAEGVIAPYEKEFLRKDGRRVPVVIGAALIDEQDYDGVAFALDVTARKENERALQRLMQTLEDRVEDRTEALARANRTLELRNRELQDFAYVASHDLQEPLRKIRAFADVVLRDYHDQLDDEGRYFLDRIQDAANRMSVLIADLLTFSRVATQAKPFETVDLDHVLEHVLSDLEVRIRETGGTVDASPLPTIEADATQMRQLFQNLVGNALKFHRPDVPPVIRIATKEVQAPGGTLLQLTIADNGIGFDPKFAERIFAPFQRLHNRHQYDGTGIGLAICRRIVERHHGTIEVESEEDAGTLFIIHLPLHHPEPDGA